MSTTFRAAYYSSSTGQETLLTGPEHSHLTDSEIESKAIESAIDAGLVDMDETDSEAAFPKLTREDFLAGLSIGDWTE